MVPKFFKFTAAFLNAGIKKKKKKKTFRLRQQFLQGLVKKENTYEIKNMKFKKFI